MRTKRAYFKRVCITEEIYDRLIQDRDHFQEVIGGGKWSISDTINEYLKIIKTYKDGEE